MKNIFFVDLENVGRTFLEGNEQLGVEDEVILFNNTVRGKKVPGSIIQEIKKFKCKVKFINTKCHAKNALDMEICTALGFAIGEHQTAAKYFIISKDNDYWPCIYYIREHIKARVYVTIIHNFKEKSEYEDRRNFTKELLKDLTVSKKHIRIAATGFKKCKTVEEYHEFLQKNTGAKGQEIFKATREEFEKQLHHM